MARITDIRTINDDLIMAEEISSDFTSNLIEIPDLVRWHSYFGFVVRVGPGRWNRTHTERIPIPLKEGQIIIYNKTKGNRMKFQPKPNTKMKYYTFLKERFLWGVITLKNETPKIRPMRDMILIKPDTPERMSKGGVIVLTDRQEKYARTAFGRVEAVGPGYLNDKNIFVETTVKVGQNVMFPQFGAIELRFGGEDYVLFSEEDLYSKEISVSSS